MEMVGIENNEFVAVDFDGAEYFSVRSTPENVEAEARAQSLLKELTSEKDFNNYMDSGILFVKGESGNTWQFKRSAMIYSFVCPNGHHNSICQVKTGRNLFLPPTDNVIIPLLHIKRGIKGEREIVKTGGKAPGLSLHCSYCRKLRVPGLWRLYSPSKRKRKRENSCAS